jgi:hypothetical protein
LIVRTKKDKDNPYASINKIALNDKILSFKAKGLFAYLMSKPDDWSVMVSELAKASADKETSVRSALVELEKQGYITRRQARSGNGTFSSWEYIVYETPHLGNPNAGEPKAGEPNSENRTLLNNDLLSNELLSNKKDILSSSIEKEKKIKFAEFVSMTEKEYDKLYSEYGEKTVREMIDILDNYKGSKGAKYKSDYRAILSWVIKEHEKRNPKPKLQNIDSSDQMSDEEARKLIDGGDPFAEYLR